MLTVRGQPHSFAIHEMMFLRKCLSFRERKCLDPRGTRNPNRRIHAECFNHWAIRAIQLLSYVFYYRLWRDRYFVVKSIFEMLTVRRQQHSFSTHKRMFFWKCRNFSDRKYLDPRGTKNPNPWIHRPQDKSFNGFPDGSWKHWGMFLGRH